MKPTSFALRKRKAFTKRFPGGYPDGGRRSDFVDIKDKHGYIDTYWMWISSDEDAVRIYKEQECDIVMIGEEL
ncbi:hypothetical protein M0R04_07965 [Candidatus Dojkabacteria bacterium]|jgi:hypothetical protein|nr:hypothetical protein [Candidatus Dojkabacteria bacterium]